MRQGVRFGIQSEMPSLHAAAVEHATTDGAHEVLYFFRRLGQVPQHIIDLIVEDRFVRQERPRPGHGYSLQRLAH